MRFEVWIKWKNKEGKKFIIDVNYYKPKYVVMGQARAYFIAGLAALIK